MGIYQIRLRKLEELLAEKFDSKKVMQLAEVLEMQPSSISHYWTTNPKNHRNIDDETARKIEVIANKPSGWMDQLDLTANHTAIVDTEAPEQPVLSAQDMLLIETVHELDADQQAHLITFISSMARQASAKRDDIGSLPSQKNNIASTGPEDS